MSNLQEQKQKKSLGASRLAAAKRDFRKMQREIEPFLRPRKIRIESSAGKWIDTSTLDLLDN
jgi:hypothetical protein